MTTGTAAIGIVAHLDGSGSTTFLLTIPALLPLYRALGISRYILITIVIVALAASVMNMVPWAGPLGRAGAVIAQEPSDIWLRLLPIQGVVLVLVVAAGLGLQRRRRIAARGAATADVEASQAQQDEERREEGYSYRTGTACTVANVAVVLVALVILLAGLLPPAPTFLIATTLALLINFPDSHSQSKVLRRHAPNALSMAGIIIAAAMFLGVLNETGMLEQIALSLVSVLPAAVGPYLHVIVGLLGVPLDLLTSTDAHYFSVLPIVQETAASFGVSGMSTALALIIGNVIGTFVSPFSPALWLALGLAGGANMGRYIKLAFPIAWAFSAALVLVAFASGMLG